MFHKDSTGVIAMVYICKVKIDSFGYIAEIEGLVLFSAVTW